MCPKELSEDPESHTLKLRTAIRAKCIGGGFEDGFPKYVWVWLGDDLWEARHIRGPVGTYKAYGPLEAVEKPLDPDGVLAKAHGADS
ncbi:MAG: hypothetical protein AUK47_04495 [Deltaproteobacteria bacterium CG2_30_63_29]|nr:MAG: hypothetical protein AUK47_04495 [Deltaproteobacteria bacterium CG2_30_63_29]